MNIHELHYITRDMHTITETIEHKNYSVEIKVNGMKCIAIDEIRCQVYDIILDELKKEYNKLEIKLNDFVSKIKLENK